MINYLNTSVSYFGGHANPLVLADMNINGGDFYNSNSRPWALRYKLRIETTINQQPG